MPKIKASALTDRTIRSSKPKEKDYKLTDGEGLFLLVAKSGGKRWRFKYRFDNKEKIYAIGTYPDISLSQARAIKSELRSKVAAGISPADEKQKKKREQKSATIKKATTLESVINDSLAKRSSLSENYLKKLEDAFKRDVIFFIGDAPIANITKADIIEVLERIESRGAVESAHRMLTQLNRVFKYALNRDYITVNVCERIDRKETLSEPKTKHYPIITDNKELRILLNMIDNYPGDFPTKMALSFMPYVAARPYNIRSAEWSEMDFEKKRWLIPAAKMKTKKEHIIPLSDSAIAILEEAAKISKGKQYIFPSYRHPNSPMSDNTLNLALKRMGFTGEQIVPHSFRGIFSTIANEHIREHGVHPKIIDIQLAHSEAKGKTEKSYNRAIYLEEREILMQWWSNYLDRLKRGSK